MSLKFHLAMMLTGIRLMMTTKMMSILKS